MRTIFVNPSVGRRARRKKASKGRKRAHRRHSKNPGSSLASYKRGMKDAMKTFSNPGRRRKHRRHRKNARPQKYAVYARPIRPRRRRHKVSAGFRTIRSNAGITPFVSGRSNPMILNPHHRRRRRRNPGLLSGLGVGGLPSLRSAVGTIVSAGAGSALGVLLNGFVLNKQANPWVRNGLRLASAVGAGMLLRGKREMACAAAGAIMYPTIQELALRYLPSGTGFEPTTPALPTDADLDIVAADLDAALSDYEDDRSPIF